jgi:hypothetical protein
MSTAQVIPFKKPSQPKQEAGKSMYSDKFHQGYVMSSRLYRKEVWPFLSDAARNVYAELENRINGHNKESDFVSYSQLQGGDLEGSRQLSRETVRNGLKELLKLKIVSVSSTGPRGVKKYKLNEVSLKDQFGNKTSSTTEPVRKVNQTSSTTEPVTSSETEHTIDSSIDSLDIKKNRSLVDKSKTEMFSESIEYHGKDKTEYSLRELAGVYTIQSDLMNQAKQINPKLDDEKIMSELKNFAQWSTSQNKTTAQGWMNFWIYRIKNLKTSKPRNSQGGQSEKTMQSMTPKQIAMFAPKLCEHQIFKTNFAEQGESQAAFVSRIGLKLRNPENQRKWMNHLRDCGFTGNLEGCEA